jgi:protein-S-isoprenylcysteine O-methyltransferase Ste14
VRNLKYFAVIVLLVLLVPTLSYWLAENMISFIFSIAAVGYPENWCYVILNLILLCLFVLFINFRRRVTRLPASIYLAFIVALYIEMYGFPLTMYIMTWLLGYSNPGNLWYFLVELTGKELFVSIFLGLLLPISNIIILVGIFLIAFGWKGVFRTRGKLVTTGLYGYVRHPQYLGFLVFTTGINVLWLTISTIILWPILVTLYYRLAKEEEKRLEEKFGEEYRRYKNKVPMFIPRL